MGEEATSINKGIRNTNIDALKALSMMMVVILHATRYGVENIDIADWSFVFWIVNIGRSFCIVAVNVFVLISGYFSCNKTSSAKKLITLWLTVQVFSIGMYLILSFSTAAVSFDLKTLIIHTLPVLTHQYWFFTYYLILMIISPILNELISILSQTRFRRYLVVLLVLFSAIPTINIFGYDFGTNGGYGIIWFVLLYFIGAYLRRYTVSFHGGWLYLVSAALLVLTGVISSAVPRFSFLSNRLFNYNSVLVLAASVGLFWFAANSKHVWKHISGKIIISISSVSFGVYLLHEHGTFRDILWHSLVRLEDLASKPASFLLRVAIAIVGIYTIGCFAYFVVQNILRRLPFNKSWKELYHIPIFSITIGFLQDEIKLRHRPKGKIDN